MEKEKFQMKTGHIMRLLLPLVILAGIIVVFLLIWKGFFGDGDKSKEKTTIVTSSQLEKVLQISDLSTYKVTFNGVADVKDSQDNLLYNVAYEAKVSVGLNMEEINVQVDDSDTKNRKIIVTLPEIEITDTEVNPGSLDYIFEKNSANTENVSMTALPACKADAEEECKSNTMLFELARENAANTVKALINPLLEQYEDYSLEIIEKGGAAYE